MQAGIIASSNVNLHRKRGSRPLAPYDFMPFHKKPATVEKPISEWEFKNFFSPKRTPDRIINR